ncbi:MAG: hypothetical protein JRH11_02600 [Deltaproteobacteria bacterium]|nr:hypothetical protein [Deltaproteobacteria bacterium]
MCALASLTCAGQPAVTAAPAPLPTPEPSTGADVAPAPPEPEVLAEAPVGPAFEPIDDGVPGLRIPIYDPSGVALSHFHEALRRAAAGDGQARLAFYGASHVAADLFTGYLRTQLQTRFGDAGHGFVLPAHPWRTYRHQGITIESNRRLWTGIKIRASSLDVDHYGLAGTAVETTRAGAWGALTTSTRGDLGRSVSRYDLYYLAQPGGGAIEVKIDGQAVETVRTAASAKGAGYATFEVEDGAHRFEVRTVGNGPVRIFGVASERTEPGVIVDTLGINGARARYHLLWEDEMYREHLARRAPDLITLAYGTNEAGDDDVPIATYEARMRQVVSRVREIVPEASCLLIGPSDRPIRENGDVLDRPRTLELVEAQKRVSAELGCGFFDLVEFMGGPMSMVDWVAHEPAYGAPDHIHYTRRGYLRLGEALHYALLHGLDDGPQDTAQDAPQDGITSDNP